MKNSTALQQTIKTLLPYFNWIATALISVLGFIGLHWLRNPDKLAILGLSGLITIGAIGTWRWSWWIVQVVRSQIYLRVVFPLWRRRANQIPVEDLPPICFLVPTYKEKPWITERVFRAIATEAQSLAQPITLLVTSSSDAENAAIVKILESVDPNLSSIRLIQMVQTGEGKRKAMADALQELALLDLPENTIVALMDGDSELTPGTLRKCLPFFKMFPKIGALTTDELPIVSGSYIFSEWFHLRLAQRHYQMSSVSLSGKVMCLTGRFSLFRAQAALHPSFANQLEIDTLNDWLWGKFKFLSGDDKSTWFWLLKQGYDMIYVPDTIVYSIETISGSLVDRAYQNMRRWYGNMLRNSDRAIALGPQKNGWFMWWCLIDQRISYWTSLITPGLLLIALFQAQWLSAGVITSWILFSRPLMLIVVFWQRQSQLKPIHFPLLLVSQWASSLVKIWTQMNLAQQKWTNRGNQSISAEGSGWEKLAKISTSWFLLVSQAFCFVILLLSLANILNPLEDLAGLWWNSQVSAASPTQIITAIDRGIYPNDGKDDSAALQALIKHLPSEGKVKINLPIGEIELLKPLQIQRSNTTIQGQGVGRTILLANFGSQIGDAAISIHPRQGKQFAKDILKNVYLQGFTLMPNQSKTGDNAINGIVLEKVAQGGIKNLEIKANGGRPLTLRETQNVQVEYVTMDSN
ncbi:glycosyltransferase [Nostoc sp.]|uniref:glycosyltransferase n=1 Tax=Nostoc sp. TaxID=1180 RepID=UPI00359390DE